MPAPATQQAYSREEVRRQLGVSKRQLDSWEKQNLLPSGGSFSFSDILALRTLVGLRKSNVSAVQIRKAVHAVRKHFREFENPLTEVKIYSQGKKIEVQFAGNKKMEAISGQLILNFDQAEISKLLSFPGQAEESEAARKMKSRREAEHWFEKGLDLEQTGAPAEEVIAAYQKAAEIDPTSAGALVNLGTVYFNARDWRLAEQYYRKAVEVDPRIRFGAFQSRQSLRRARRPARRVGSLSGRHPHSSALCRRALQHRAAVSIHGTAVEGRASLEGILDDGPRQRLGRDRPPRAGQDQGSRYFARPTASA